MYLSEIQTNVDSSETGSLSASYQSQLDRDAATLITWLAMRLSLYEYL